MGWNTIPGKSKAETMAIVKADLMFDSWIDVIAYAESETAQWFLLRYPRSSGTVFAQVNIYEGTSYKDISTDMGPYRYDIPLAWIDQLDDAGGYTADYKGRARAFKGKRAVIKSL